MFTFSRRSTLCLLVSLSVWLVAPAMAQNPCVVVDDGSGTVALPPPGCDYLSPNDVHVIIDGLPPGTIIELDARHAQFTNVTTSPGGTLGGEIESFNSTLELHITGGDLERTILLPVATQVHTGPRTLGEPVQVFPTEMFQLQGQIFGDPDFDLLRIRGGSGFGMPSPGQTTLTQLPSGNWNVDSFFDITYEIEFQGGPAGPLAGLSGTTTTTIRMATGEPIQPIPPCVVPDDGTGTVTLPPPGCGYLSPDDVHVIINGLPAGTEIQLGAEHAGFFNIGTSPGGGLGGNVETFDSNLKLRITGLGIDRTVDVAMACETHTGPRGPGDMVQDFDTDMFRMEGQLPPGDPDFDLLRIRGGTDFGLPSPGHTTLTRLPSGDFNVDSFFDIDYRIEFVGHAGGPLDGMAGTTTGTIRMQTGVPLGSCPPLAPGLDIFPSTGKVVIQLFGPGSDPFIGRLSSAGFPDAIVQRGIQVGDTVPTEILQLELVGVHPALGEIRVHQSSTQPSLGELTHVIQDPVTCELLEADSFFDVWIEMELPALGETWKTDRPLHLQRKIHRLPPEDEPYENPFVDPVTLVDIGSGTTRGQILYHLHHADPPFPPRDRDCLDTLLSAQLNLPSLGFSGPIDASGPTMIQRQSPVSAGTCSGSLMPCARDADCPLGEVCVLFTNTIQTEIVQMDLTGAAPGLGNFHVGVTPALTSPPLPPSLGQASSQSGSSTYAADSFFDVFVDIQLPDLGTSVRTGPSNPVHVDASSITGSGIRNTPPDPQSSFQSPAGAVPLFTEDGSPVGDIQNVVHTVGPPTDWELPPPPGEDCFDSWVHLELTIDSPFCQEDLWLPGGFRVLRGTPYDPPPLDGQEVIDTLMAKLDLRGTSSCIGPLRLGLAPTATSGGSVSSLAPAEFFPADSFFDIDFRIESGLGQLTTSGPTHMTTTVNSLPPEAGEIYWGPGTVIPIYDEDGFEIGHILEVSHEIHRQVDCPEACLPYILGLAGGAHDVGIQGGGGGVLYDVVLGLLSDLHSSGGDLSAATCIQNNGTPVLSVPDPSAGDAYYLLSRDVFGGFNGTWNSSGSGQVANRDPQLASECN